MPNNTFEDYKKAVKKKYEIEKNNDHFVYLNSPTRAKLRNLCWELFQQQNRNQDDLNVFSSLLGLTFDVNKKNKFEEQIDKFRPIEKFFKGGSDPAIVDAVNMAAILVDFKARPFNKFRIQELFEDEVQLEDEDKLEVLNPQMELSSDSGSLETFLNRKEREKVEMKRQILDAARSLFLEQGFEKTSIRNIAEVIEYSAGTIYLYFKENFIYQNVLNFAGKLFQ